MGKLSGGWVGSLQSLKGVGGWVGGKPRNPKTSGWVNPETPKMEWVGGKPSIPKRSGWVGNLEYLKGVGGKP